jgi:hypothetical protein
MHELDARPPVPSISFTADPLPPERKRHIAATSANLLRAAATSGDFGELWLAESLGEALADTDTAALALCDLADLAVMLTRALAAAKGLDADEVLDHVTRTWVEQAP